MSNNPLKDIHEHFNADVFDIDPDDPGSVDLGFDRVKELEDRQADSVESFIETVEKTWTLKDVFLCEERWGCWVVGDDDPSDFFPDCLTFRTKVALRCFRYAMSRLRSAADFCFGACSALRIIDAEDEHLMVGRSVNLTKTIAELKAALQAHDFQPDEVLAEVRKLLEGLREIKESVDANSAKLDANSAKLDALADWLKDWRENGKNIDEKNPPKTQISANARNAVLRAWEEYIDDPDKYAADVITRKKGQKPTFEECLKNRGGNKVHKGETLNALLDAAARPGEKPAATFKRLVRSAQRQGGRKA